MKRRRADSGANDPGHKAGQDAQNANKKPQRNEFKPVAKGRGFVRAWCQNNSLERFSCYWVSRTGLGEAFSLRKIPIDGSLLYTYREILY